MRTKEEVVHAFTPVGKLDVVTEQKLLKMQTLFKEAAAEILDLVPESADRTAALRKLLEAKMTCVQALTHVKPMQAPNSSVAQEKKPYVKNN